MMIHRFIVVLAGLVLLTLPARGDEFHSDFPGQTPRSWIGPAYYANRLEDWRLRAGRVECIEARPRRPVRTLHLLTRVLGPNPGSFTITVRTGPVTPGDRGQADAWTGFLIGAGGDHVDYRLTAQVHHAPAEDGGLLAVMDNRGIVTFRDFSHRTGRGGLWSLGSALGPDDAPELPELIQHGEGFASSRVEPVMLRLLGHPEGDGYTLTLSATRHGLLISEAVARNVAPSLVDGCIALVAHLAPTGEKTGAWFDDWTASGDKVIAHDDRAFGPILCALHTLSGEGGGVLKLTAQMGPLGERDTRTATLQVRRDGSGDWETVASAELVEDSYTFPFRVERWDAARDTPYRVVYDLRTGPGRTERFTWEGVIRAEPTDDEFVIAAFTGHKIYTGGLKWNENGLWFPSADIVDAVRTFDPDLLFFSGDQIYEGDLTPADRPPRDRGTQDYLYKWIRWCWAFGDLARDIPTVCLPDDHDVYHGNIWGAAGKRAAPDPRYKYATDRGGYSLPTWFVNAIHDTQVSHLPDPVDPMPLDNGISVYFTRLEYGGISFAILADRMFKSAPAVVIPDGGVVNGWFQNPGFDPPTQADVPGATLLGERQLAFLNDWAVDWGGGGGARGDGEGGAWMKVVLSQTIFANVATIPVVANSGSVLPSLPTPEPGEYPTDYKLAADCDSNGWPQTGRNKALRAMRRGFALHIAGDQHLGSTIHYGIDDWDDAGYALCVPSIANTWPRRWFPPKPGLGRRPDQPAYTGRFRDGFGNLMTVLAVSNPVHTGHEPAALHDRAPGYGIVRLNKKSGIITIECWPRWADPTSPNAMQYPGWPITIAQTDNYGRKPTGVLPRLTVLGMTDPVVQVIDEASGQVIYALRIHGDTFRPWVFEDGSYTVRIGEPDLFKTITGLHPEPHDSDRTIHVEF